MSGGHADVAARRAVIDEQIALGYQLYTEGRFSEFPALLDAGAALQPGLDSDEDLRLRAHLLLSAHLGRWVYPPWLLDVDPLRLPLQRPAQRYHALMLAAEHADVCSSQADGIDLLERVTARAVDALDGPAREPLDATWLLDTASYLAWGERLASADRLLALVPQDCDQTARLQLLHRRSLVALRRGEASSAIDFADQLATEAADFPWYVGRAVEYRVIALDLLGERDESAALIKVACAENPTDVALQLLRADLTRDNERIAVAAEDVMAFQPARLQPHLRTAKAHLRIGQVAEAQACLIDEISLQIATGSPGMQAEALAVLAGTHVDQVRTRLLEEAVALAATSERHHSRGRVFATWGDHLLAQGDLVGSRRAYAETLDLAVADLRHDAAEAAERALRKAGGRPRRFRTRGPSALTAAQREVASMAARGLTNRQIAAELWLTEKTIESHLRASFRILGVQRRTEVGDALYPGR